MNFCWEFIGYPVVPVVTTGFLQGTVYRGLTEEDEPVAIKVLFYCWSNVLIEAVV